jgi:hypothetical protein
MAPGRWLCPAKTLRLRAGGFVPPKRYGSGPVALFRQNAAAPSRWLCSAKTLRLRVGGFVPPKPATPIRLGLSARGTTAGIFGPKDSPITIMIVLFWQVQIPMPESQSPIAGPPQPRHGARANNARWDSRTRESQREVIRRANPGHVRFRRWPPTRTTAAHAADLRRPPRLRLPNPGSDKAHFTYSGAWPCPLSKEVRPAGALVCGSLYDPGRVKTRGIGAPNACAVTPART